MSLIKIFKHRDHNNGGKFDGNCAVDTMQGFGTYYYYGVRCRFRPEEFDSGVQAIWGVGDPSKFEEYTLRIVESSGSYYFRITWLDVDYNFIGFPVICGTFYEVQVQKIASSTIRLLVTDQYANELYYSEVANTSDEVTYSLSTNNVYVAASNDGSGMIDPFTGIIYDWDYMDTGTSDFFRYVFYKNYHDVDDDEVADFLNANTGDIIGTMPDDFWPERVDISKKIKKGSSAIMKMRQDKFRTQMGNSMNLILFNYDDIKVGDTIEIQIGDDVINNKTSFLLNISEIKKRSYHVIRIQCEDIFMSLKYVLTNNFAQQAEDIWTTTDNFWWSTYRQGSTDDYYWDVGNLSHRYVSLKYILNYTRCILQYDNLISLNYATLLSSDSSYKFYDTGTTYNLNYSELIWHLGMIRELGSSDSTEGYVRKTYVFFRAILNALRITYYFNSGEIVFSELTYGNTIPTKFYFNETDKIINVKFYQIEAPVIEQTPGGTVSPSSYFGSYDSSDIITKVANNIDNNFLLEEKDLIINNKLPKAFWIFRKHRHANSLVYIQNNDTFIDQYVTKLDNELRGLKEYEEKTIPLIKEFSTDYYFKEDDLIKWRSKIKQEVAS